MILKDALRAGINELKSANVETPVVDAGVILCHVLNCDKVFLYTHEDLVLQNETYEAFFDKIRKRAEGTPVQYIMGYQEFMSLNFIVDESVLIPRADTEILVETAIEQASQLKTPSGELKILDIGTGSGCIAISLSYYLKNCSTIGVDISKKALKIARLNAEKIGVTENTTFIQSNLFDNLELSGNDGRFDLIVSNPPYIETDVIKTLQREVRDYEPISALDGGIDGLGFYRDIVDKAPNYLNRNGLLMFEVGYNQWEQVAGIMEKSFCDILAIKDISGINRVVKGRLKS